MSDPSAKTTGHLAPPTAARRRASSVGRIDVGDNRLPLLLTMPALRLRLALQVLRLEALESSNLSDATLVSKIGLAVFELCVRHIWLGPLAVMVVVYGVYFASGNYTPLNPLHALVTLSYAIPNTDPVEYGKGPKDFLFVGFVAVFFTFFREFMVLVVLGPIATNVFGITKEGKLHRFMEQTYLMVYYGIMGPLGLYVMKHYAPGLWYFNTDALYQQFPHKTHVYWFKFYYLFQAGFWCQQSLLLALQVEKPRKDFKELVFHHIITIMLIFLSYRFHFTWMGVAIYVTMDLSDFVLALSKTAHYVDSPATTPLFLMFVVTWIYFRHYLNLKVLYSVLTTFRTVGPFELNWETQQYKCTLSQVIVFALIFALQLVNAYWLYLILRILYRYVVGNGVEDVRSDEEEEGEEEKEKEKEAKTTKAKKA